MATTVESYLESNAGEAQALLEQLCRQPSVAAQGLGIAEMQRRDVQGVAAVFREA